jgi:integrase
VTNRNADATWTVYQRGDTGAWMLRFKDPDSGKWRDKRIPTTARVKTRGQAEAWARSWLAEQAEERAAEANKTGTSLGDYLDGWLDRRAKNPNVRITTLCNNRGHVTQHIKPALGARRLSEMTPATCRDFVVKLRDTHRKDRRKVSDGQAMGKLAPLTVRNVAATLRAALDEAFDEGLLPANPMRSKAVQRELPRAEKRAGANVVVHLPRADAERLLTCTAVPDERRVRYLLALTAGLRDGEIAALRWSDVDLGSALPFIDVSRAFSSRYESTAPKTVHGYRKVPLHKLTARALRAWKSSGFVVLVGRHAKPTDPVFPSAEGKHHRPRSAALIREDLARAGCSTTYAGQDIDFHALRRSFATWLAEAEVPEGLRRRLMGHSGSDVTDAHYTSKALGQLLEAVQRITLNIKTGKLVRLPMRRAAGVPNDGAQTDGLAAPLAAPVQQAIDATPRNQLAPPRRFERPTNGLGNRCSIH